MGTASSQNSCMTISCSSWHTNLDLNSMSVTKSNVFCAKAIQCVNCRDWFRKGMTIFDCNTKGEFFRRDYGKENGWVKLHPPSQYEFAYVRKRQIVYIPVDAASSYLAVDFGKELRTQQSSKKLIRFKGRDSKTSSHQRTYKNIYSTNDTHQHPSMQMADFYMASHVQRLRIKHMFVLGDTESAA